MAGKTNNTRPVSAAIGKPVAPWLTPVSAADPMRSGFYVGRRWEWGAGWQEVVYLDVLELDGEWSFSIRRCGSSKVEHPEEWQFIMRVGGIRSMPGELIDLTATRH